MKQLSIFQSKSESGTKEKIIWKLYVDGASRKNPGLAGAGVYVLKNNIPVYKRGFFLGHKTNNQAEYLALLLGIIYCKKHMSSHDQLTILSDSELLVKHLTGVYKIKNISLKQYFDVALHLLQDLSYSFYHVVREENTQADALANEGIDKRIAIPQEFITVLHAHDISL